MIRKISKAESERGNERVRALWSSDYMIDRVTAVLCDINVGGSGLHEGYARAKAESILHHIGIELLAKVNRDLTRTSQCAIATGVLRHPSDFLPEMPHDPASGDPDAAATAADRARKVEKGE